MNPVRKLLNTRIIERLSGLTYSTAIIATHGYYLSPNDYIHAGEDEMSILFSYLDKQKNYLRIWMRAWQKFIWYC